MLQLKTKLLALVCGILVFSACSNDDDDNKSQLSAEATAGTLKQGAWRITHFSEEGADETYHFTGYAFTFRADGNIAAVKNTATVNGTWHTGSDDSNNKFYLDFGANVPFDELNDDWRIVENSATKVRLEDVSGGNGGTDLLTFEKN